VKTESTKSQQDSGVWNCNKTTECDADLAPAHALKCVWRLDAIWKARTFLCAPNRHCVPQVCRPFTQLALSLSLSTYIPLDRTPFSELMTWGNLINIYMYFGREKWVEVGRWWLREEEDEEVQRDAKWGSFGSTWRASITIEGSWVGPDRKQGTQYRSTAGSLMRVITK